MKTVNLFVNGCAQFVIGSVSAANDLCIKVPGVVLNEVSNIVDAGLHLAADRTKRSLTDPSMEKKHYAKYLRENHAADARRQRYINGSVPIEDLWSDITLPNFIKDTLKKDKHTVTQPIIIVEDK